MELPLSPDLFNPDPESHLLRPLPSSQGPLPIVNNNNIVGGQ